MKFAELETAIGYFMIASAAGILSIPTALVYCAFPAHKMDEKSVCYNKNFTLTQKCMDNRDALTCNLVGIYHINVKEK